MTAKKMLYDTEAREAILRGVQKLARAVKVTLGPAGHVVVISGTGGASPRATKDGVTVAKEIELESPYDNMGAEIVREAADRTTEEAGDGTTTATIYAEAVFKEGLKNITAGADATQVKRGIDRAVAELTAELGRMARKVSDSEQLVHVATCSANDRATHSLITKGARHVPLCPAPAPRQQSMPPQSHTTPMRKVTPDGLASESDLPHTIACLHNGSADAYTLASRHLNPKLVRVMDILGFNKNFVRAEGCFYYDEDDTAYLDFHSGEGFASLGHNHPDIRSALIEGMTANLPDGVQIHYSSLSGRLAESLCRHLPVGLDAVFFTNSGTETVEAALKFARAASGRPRLLSCDNGYHGLTYGSLSVSSEEYFQKGFGPLLPGCSRVPFDDLDRLESELKKKDVAAFIVEPIQGRTVCVPQQDYFKEVERLCRRYNTFLIFDEIQTGLGRTGRWFALEHWGVEPDFVLVSKALSGGYMPVGAMVTRRAIYDKVVNTLDRCYVQHSTSGRNRLSMLAGLATIEVIERDSLVERTAEMGERLMNGLSALKERYPLIKSVRGKGLMIGFELECPSSIRGSIAWKTIHAASAGLFPQLIVIPLHQNHQIITMASGHNDVIKLLPPMTIGPAECDSFLNGLDTVLASCQDMGSQSWKTVFNIAVKTVKGSFGHGG